ncbi:MAG: phosphate acyltransferase PlsX [Thermodesulfobacteria bacterium]|nr:phosphate acyltransferase PlsX [Thermodesulfobacteriota bacterium]
MAIALDAMGGDRGPSILVQGAVEAAREFGTEIILVGKADLLEQELVRARGTDLPIYIQNATQIVEMAESPSEALRKKKDSSVRVAFDLVKEGRAKGVVSAGNSGATLATAMFILGRIKGVRPAIGTLVPTLKDPSLIIDVGANVDCKPHHLLQFGIMGSLFVKEFLKKEEPRVGLLSIGEEGSKGNQQVKKAYDLLAASNLNFFGNVEGRDVFRGEVDVIVCDGFVGNICLKLSEGLAETVIAMLKNEIEGNFLAIMGYGLAKKAFKRFKKRVDYAEYGGAPLLGVKGTAIICHGSSESKAVKNAIGVAHNLANLDLAEKLEASMSNRKDILRII